MRDFLLKQFPSKSFMQAIGVKKTTLHRWAERGYIHLGSPGTGKTVVLTGEEILYAACLGLISKAGGSPHFLIRSLHLCVTSYAQNIKSEWWREVPDRTPSYAVFKFVDRGDYVDAEWDITEDPMYRNHGHEVEGHGDKPAPYFAVINLTELLTSLIFKIEGRHV